MSNIGLEVLKTLEELKLNHFSIRETLNGQTDLVLNDNILITTIKDDEEKIEVLERIITKSVLIIQILKKAAEQLEDYVIKADQ
jgi:hypothetical protein